jgi:hypothetical protein
MTWEEYFRIVYHPGGGAYWIIHWKDSSIPVECGYFSERKQAEIWLKYYYQEILNKEFEKIVLT